MRDARAPVALLFTQQLVGLGGRKTGMVYWAETLARMGWRTHAVTAQLSWLSRLARSPRLAAVPRPEINQWTPRGENLFGYVWEAPLHPARLGPADGLLGEALARFYAGALPKDVIEIARRADLIVVESCAAVALVSRLRALAPVAKLVYCASDRLDAVGMSPALSRILARDIGAFDLMRVPAAAMLEDFGPSAPVALIPQGVDKRVLDACPPARDRGDKRVAIVAGDMAFDSEALRTALEAFPDLEIHAYGRMDVAALRRFPNLVVHGERPFAELAGRLRVADIGFAPYVSRPRLDYLAESSLKLQQYSYCRLPTVAPHFARGGRAHVIGYAPGDAESVRDAFARALAFDRSTIDPGAIPDWEDVIARLLSHLNLSDRAGAALAQDGVVESCT